MFKIFYYIKSFHGTPPFFFKYLRCFFCCIIVIFCQLCLIFSLHKWKDNYIHQGVGVAGDVVAFLVVFVVIFSRGIAIFAQEKPVPPEKNAWFFWKLQGALTPLPSSFACICCGDVSLYPEPCLPAERGIVSILCRLMPFMQSFGGGGWIKFRINIRKSSECGRTKVFYTLVGSSKDVVSQVCHLFHLWCLRHCNFVSMTIVWLVVLTEGARRGKDVPN